MTAKEDKKVRKLKDEERLCQKCNTIVTLDDFNSYFKICIKCENKSTGGH